MSDYKLSNAYANLLKKVRKAKQDGEKIGIEYWDKIHQLLIDAEKLNAEESKIVVDALQRDLGEARYVLNELGKAITDWLKYDAAIVEDNLEDWLELVADDTLVDWIHLRKQWEYNNHYMTGDLVGIGEYSCTKCGQLLHILKPTHIQPCTHCQGTEFQREVQH